MFKDKNVSLSHDSYSMELRRIFLQALQHCCSVVLEYKPAWACVEAVLDLFCWTCGGGGSFVLW